MCPDCEDFARTVLLLGQLALYADEFGADHDFIESVAPSLAASLPEPLLGTFLSDYDPTDGPDHPGGW